MQSNLKKTLFISDLHLDEQHQEIASLFLKLLETCDASVDGLYILGDLFESWIGDDDNSLFHQRIIQALNNATQKGLKIFFMHGNRDFLIGKRFSDETGCKLLPDEKKILLYGTPVLLMHGDSLCTRDVAYQSWRKKSRGRFIQTLFLFLPLSFRRKIAEKARSKSTAHTRSTNMAIMDVTHSEVDRVLQHHHAQILIHGHTHRPGIHENRIVLGAWHDAPSILIWDEAGHYVIAKGL